MKNTTFPHEKQIALHSFASRYFQVKESEVKVLANNIFTYVDKKYAVLTNEEADLFTETLIIEWINDKILSNIPVEYKKFINYEALVIEMKKKNRAKVVHEVSGLIEYISWTGDEDFYIYPEN